jgi:periplasmic protein TonB
MSDLGSLSQCMLESDVESLSTGRVLRRKALTLSIALETALIAAIFLAPLLFPSVLPKILAQAPAPPYHRGFTDIFVQQMPHGPSAPATPNHNVVPIFAQPPRIPNSVYSGPDAAPSAPSAPGDPGDGMPGGDIHGLGIPGGLGTQPPPELKPPAPEKPTRPVKVSQGVMAASILHQVQPSYTPVERTMRLSGEVLLHAIIGKDGSVRELQIVSGNPLLAQTAIAAVRQWRYRPTLLNGEAVDVDTIVSVKFVLNTD